MANPIYAEFQIMVPTTDTLGKGRGLSSQRFIKIQKNFRPALLKTVEKVWALPGADTPVVPDLVDVLDSGGVVEEVGVVA